MAIGALRFNKIIIDGSIEYDKYLLANPNVVMCLAYHFF